MRHAALALCILSVICLTARAIATDQPATQPSMAAAASLGPEHEFMGKWIGDWDCDVTVIDQGTNRELKTKGAARFEPIMQGRYVRLTISYQLPGDSDKIEGEAIMGYDTGIKQFVLSWIDSEATGITNQTGDLDADAKVLTFTGEQHDPTNGQVFKTRGVITHVDADHMNYEEFFTVAGQEMKNMGIQFTRKH